ncbi:hypothetical protein EVAR_22453_1 [Eumeta japonica]|uniref:Uncharacterized protein n=1 Tax=Eumeta variegata TaxID=151549 RepID=A0A4C1VBT9_EUMVA|nr:hypothetical protein EVAR_22453_1 [Eumeta japonica]
MYSDEILDNVKQEGDYPIVISYLSDHAIYYLQRYTLAFAPATAIKTAYRRAQSRDANKKYLATNARALTVRSTHTNFFLGASRRVHVRFPGKTNMIFPIVFHFDHLRRLRDSKIVSRSIQILHVRYMAIAKTADLGFDTITKSKPDEEAADSFKIVKRKSRKVARRQRKNSSSDESDPTMEVELNHGKKLVHRDSPTSSANSVTKTTIAAPKQTIVGVKSSSATGTKPSPQS